MPKLLSNDLRKRIIGTKLRGDTKDRMDMVYNKSNCHNILKKLGNFMKKSQKNVHMKMIR